MDMLSGYRVKVSKWKEEYTVYADVICKELSVDREKLDSIVSQFVRYGILPDEYEHY